MSRHTAEHLPRPGVTGELYYAEDKSGLERRVITWAVVWPALLIASSVLAVLTENSSAAVAVPAACLLVVALFGTAGSALSLLYTRRVGIRIDSAGIRIGSLRAWERRQRSGRWPPRKPFHVTMQHRAVFTSPWAGVRALYVARDRAGLRPLSQQYRAFRKRTSQLLRPLGVLQVAEASLVIVTDPAATRSDPEKFRPNRGSMGVAITGVRSPTWVVPTRDPDALRAALALVPGVPPVHDGLPAGQDFWFSETEAARAALQAWQSQHPSPPPEPGT